MKVPEAVVTLVKHIKIQIVFLLFFFAVLGLVLLLFTVDDNKKRQNKSL